MLTKSIFLNEEEKQAIFDRITFTTDLDDVSGPNEASATAVTLRIVARDELLAELTTEDNSALDVARAVQAYLRSSQFTYSVELAEETAEGTRPEEPLVRFLETKQGYCVQFTSAMVMLLWIMPIPPS